MKHHAHDRRRLLMMTLAAAVWSPSLRAETYPSRPIRLVLGVPPGGSVDALARVLSQRLEPELGVPVIVENKPGASNKIAANVVAKSAPDGYTLLSLGSSAPLTEAAALATRTEPPFRTLREFAPIGTLVTNTYALVVNASLPVTTVNEFVAYAKAKPGQINYGSAGIGKTDHVAAELFARSTGIKMLHVPFKGIGDAINQMIAGRIQACFGALAPMAPQIRAGKLRVLGIVNAQRSRLFPEVPTIAEAVPLPGYAVEAWIGMVAPAGTPPQIVSRLGSAFATILDDRSFDEKVLVPNGMAPFLKSPTEMAAMFRSEVDRYTALFKSIDLKLA